MLGSLYNSDILTLSAGLKNTTLERPHASVRKTAKLCGSSVELDVRTADGIVTEYALRVQACALGQASAAILQAGIIGANLDDVTAARDALRDMLKHGGTIMHGGGAPDERFGGRFGKLILLSAVADYPARHGSTLLAFEAAVEALTLAQVGA